MLSKSNLILLAILCAVGSLCQQRSTRRQGHFTVVAPGTVRSNSTYNIAVSLSEFEKSLWLNISLLGMKSRDLGVNRAVEVEPGTTKIVSLKVPKLNAIEGTLRVVGYGGISWSDSVKVQIKDLNYQVYIQTDKPLYRPGDTVRFRVIGIDELTRPAVVNDSLDVLIYNPVDNLIKKISNIKLLQGVFKGELHLSEYTELGEWKILVSSRDSDVKRTSFSVSKYSLPKFRANIKGLSDVALTDDRLEFTVVATFDHGEPISGTLLLSLEVVDHQGNNHSRFNISKGIEGFTQISLDFESDLHINKTRTSDGRYVVNVGAQVRDNLTNELLNAAKKITVHSQRYKVKVQAPRAFDATALVDVKVLVTNLQNDRVPGLVHPVTIQVVGLGTQFELTAVVRLDDNGMAVAHLNLSDHKTKEFWLTAECMGIKSPGEKLKKLPEINLHLDVLTESPEVGKEFIFQVKSKTPIDHFVYEIISRGNILLTERVRVAANATTHQIRLNATFIMVPKITIFVHRVKDERFDSRLKDVYIKRSFKNSIEITADPEAKPGALVSINVTTDEGSYVGLMGVDARLLLLSENSGDLTEDHVFTRLHDYDAEYVHETKRPGFQAGIATLTNKQITGFIETTIDTRIEGEDEEFPVVKPEVHWPRLRKLFVDSWLFDDLERTQGGGWQLREACPDTITSWVITGFSLNSETGLSLTQNATKLTVFLPFHVSMDLPATVKEGETVEISVHISNYLQQNVTMQVTFESQSEHLHVVEDDDTAFKTTRILALPKNGRVKLSFFVRPLTSGHFNLTVSAVSAQASDAVQKTLTVESEGIPHLVSKTYLVNFAEDSSEDDTISVNISANSVRGSERIEVSVVGDIFGPLMESIKDLVQVPYGTCREINTHFVSNLLVLKYLKTFNHNNPRLEATSLTYLEKGFQSLLKFKHLDGSFSVVNRTMERTGDTLHTAIVLWGLQQARSFMEIDRSIIERGLQHLISKQSSTAPYPGGFSSGKGLDDDVTLTSLALLAVLANNTTAHKHKQAIINGMQYLHDVQHTLESPALRAISTYVLILGNHEKSRELLTKLHGRSSVRGKEVLWARTDSLQSNLKITAENFLNLLHSHPRQTETLFPIVRELLTSKQSQRIPAHLLALDTMIGIARTMDFGSKSLSLHFKSDQGEIAALRVNSSNVHVTQSIQLSSATRSLSLKTSGKGFAVVNIKCRYNLLQAHALPSPGYQTYVTVSDRRGLVESLKVCLALRSPEGTASNFTVMEVNLPTGYEVLENSLDSNFNEQIMSIRVNDKGSAIFTTIKDLTLAGTCIELDVLKAFGVSNVKPMSIVVYDIYNEDRKVTILHELAVPLKGDQGTRWVWT